MIYYYLTGAFVIAVGGLFLTRKILSSKPKPLEYLRLVDNVDTSESVLSKILWPSKDFLNNIGLIRKQLEEIPDDKELKIVMTTNGGDMHDCDLLLYELKKRVHPYIIYVKTSCMSAGTILALGAKEIVMVPNGSFLGKIDPQVSNFLSSYAIIDVLAASEKQIKCSLNDHIMIINAQGVMKEIEHILCKHQISINDKAKENLITSNYPHIHKFNIDDCKNMGLNVRVPTDDEMKLFK